MNDRTVGTLYIVATPIGNLGDVSSRALDILAHVDRIAAEDTRHTQKLLRHYGLNCHLTSLHGHNEQSKANALLERLLAGDNVALVSDAGTPLISDPGSQLVTTVAAAGVKVVPIPGACAAIAALSVSGLPTEHFVFEGFLPARAARRKKRLVQMRSETRTMVFYEAVHRVMDFFNECQQVFGDSRRMVVARELTKQYESVVRGTVAEIIAYYELHTDQLRGEFVVVIEGVEDEVEAAVLDPKTVLTVLLTECKASKAAALAAKLCGLKKSELYQMALTLRNDV